jgi:hypothetical protein
MLIVPPPLVECLECFDGRHTDLDLRAALARITGRLETEEIARTYGRAGSNAGFLEDEIFARMQNEKRREFAEKPVREPAHAGSAYPADAAELRETMAQYMADGAVLSATARPTACSPSPRRTSARRAAGNRTRLLTVCCVPSIAIAHSSSWPPRTTARPRNSA